MKRKKTLCAYLLAAFTVVLTVGGPATARAATITFDVGSIDAGNTPELNPSSATFTEAGFDVEAFWALSVGSPAGEFTSGHFHNVANDEEQHFNGNDQLQGLLIEATGDGFFSPVISAYRYRQWSLRPANIRPAPPAGFIRHRENRSPTVDPW